MIVRHSKLLESGEDINPVSSQVREGAMESQLHTLSKIFTERIFRIPDYQRGYAWTERQLDDFWNDIQQLHPNENHYTGVLTLESVDKRIYQNWKEDSWIIDSKGYDPLYIVDGQQRLTTSIILIQSILDVCKEDAPLNFTSHKEIRQKFIFDSKDGGISRSYIFGYEVDNPSYEHLKARIFGEYIQQMHTQETIYTLNLDKAKQYFIEKISDCAHEDLEILYRKLTQNLLFNIFTISNDVEVCVAFETMNNRGKRLSYLELLKNRLIYLSTKLEDEVYEKEKLRRSINDCWKSIYHQLGRNKLKPLDDDRFLRSHYFLYYYDEIRKRLQEHEVVNRYRTTWTGVFFEYQHLLSTIFITPRVVGKTTDKLDQIDTQSIYNYVSSLQTSVEAWYNILNPLESDLPEGIRLWLDKINRIGVAPYLTIILAIFTKTTDSTMILRLLKQIERYAFIDTLNMRAYHYRGEDDQFTKEAASLFSGKIDLRTLSKKILEQTTELVEFGFFFTNHGQYKYEKRNGFYGWGGLRYFLYEYNLYLQSQSKTDRKKIDWQEYSEHSNDYITIEHIFPQKPTAKYWQERFKGISTDQRKIIRNSLGNLLPLSRPKNASLSNRPFPEKVDGRTSEVVGFRYGSYAENEVSKEVEWTPKEIINRGVRLLTFLEKRWEISLGTDADKLRYLGVENLYKRMYAGD